jgi:hypothetical protein
VLPPGGPSATASTAGEWSDLFVASAGASAALTGLVFVAVSINLERILALATLPERALETVLLLLSVVVVSIFGLVPGQDDVALGVELLATSVVGLASVVFLILRSLPPRDQRDFFVSRLALILPGLVLPGIGGVSLIAGAGGGLYWVLAGILWAFLGAVLNAWVLLVEILR